MPGTAVSVDSVTSVIGAALGGALTVLLAVWVVVTVLNQTSRSRRSIDRVLNYDVCGLVPIWTFFAPNPGDTDTHLLFRDRDEQGRMTNWREIPLVERRRATDLWAPRRRMSKALVDVVHDLTRPDPTTDTSEPGPHPVSKQRVLSFPYLLILNYVSQLPGDFAAAERQFAIAKSAGREARDHPQVLLVSAFHKIAPALP